MRQSASCSHPETKYHSIPAQKQSTPTITASLYQLSHLRKLRHVTLIPRHTSHTSPRLRGHTAPALSHTYTPLPLPRSPITTLQLHALGSPLMPCPCSPWCCPAARLGIRPSRCLNAWAKPPPSPPAPVYYSRPPCPRPSSIRPVLAASCRELLPFVASAGLAGHSHRASPPSAADRRSLKGAKKSLRSARVSGSMGGYLHMQQHDRQCSRLGGYLHMQQHDRQCSRPVQVPAAQAPTVPATRWRSRILARHTWLRAHSATRNNASTAACWLQSS
jgi:hypothetical protein